MFDIPIIHNVEVEISKKLDKDYGNKTDFAMLKVLNNTSILNIYNEIFIFIEIYCIFE